MLIRINNKQNIKAVRQEKLEGREYLVVPMVMMVPGVHAGSDGPILYEDEDLGKNVTVWNHKPIVIDHPALSNGESISACEPEIIENEKVGLVMRSKYPKKLTSEAWLDKEKLLKHPKGGRVLSAIALNQMMEVSTGIIADKIGGPGKWRDGKEYNSKAINIAPDHLAILPDTIGACSIADGAGLLRNEAKDEFSEDRMHGITHNEMSHANIFSSINTQIRPKLTEISVEEGEFGTRRTGWLEDVFDNFFIYSHNDKLYKQDYTATKTEVTLGVNVEEVKRVTEYRSPAGAFVGNESGDQLISKKEDVMGRKELVDELIANKASGWDEDSREFLMKTDEKHFVRITANSKVATDVAKKKEDDEAEAKKKKATPPVETPTTPVTGNQGAPTKPLSDDEYIASAPPSIRAIFNYGAQHLNAERARLTGIITKNSKNAFTVEQLNKMELPELANIAAFAAEPAQNQQQQEMPAYQPNFFGAQGAIANARFSGPAASDVSEDIMETPKMDFSTRN